MINNMMMKNATTENKEEIKLEEELEKEIKKINSESKETDCSVTSTILGLFSLCMSMLSDHKDNFITSYQNEKIHDLDKRIAVCEALIRDKK